MVCLPSIGSRFLRALRKFPQFDSVAKFEAIKLFTSRSFLTTFSHHILKNDEAFGYLTLLPITFRMIRTSLCDNQVP